MNTGDATRGKAVFQQATEGHFERLLEALPGDVDSFTKVLDAIDASIFGHGKEVYMQVCGYYGDLSLLKVLVERYGNQIFKNSNGADMICEAIKFGRIDIYEYLICMTKVKQTRELFDMITFSKGFKELGIARFKGYTEMVEMVMADFNISTLTLNQTALFVNASYAAGLCRFPYSVRPSQDTLDLIAYMREMD